MRHQILETRGKLAQIMQRQKENGEPLPGLHTHAALFFGESDFQLVTPYSEPLLTTLGAIHGVTAHAEDVTFDLGRSLSTTAHHHHH